jgi:uroporphyrinogen decarboxylase
VKKMTSLERVLTALKKQEPDVVPHFESLVHKKVRDAILPGCSYEDFVEFMDIDAVTFFDLTSMRYDFIDRAKGIARDEWGAIVRFTSEDLAHPLEAPIKTEKDMDNWVPPDPDEPRRYQLLENLVKRFKGKRAIIATQTDTFYIVRDGLRGQINLFIDMIENPQLVHRMSEAVLQYQLKFIENCINIGADVIFIPGDYATAQGPMVSPEFTSRFLIPYLKRMVDYCHSRGLPVIKHTDGNIWRIFDLLVDTEIDGLHPIDPGAGMDIGRVKALYGHRVCLLGNVDCGPLLSWGTGDEVREAVRECIMKAGTGGGFICGSSNTIHSGVKPENYVAMVKAIREYGRYPLSFA